MLGKLCCMAGTMSSRLRSPKSEMQPVAPAKRAFLEGKRSSKDAAMARQCSHCPSALPSASA